MVLKTKNSIHPSREREREREREVGVVHDEVFVSPIRKGKTIFTCS